MSGVRPERIIVNAAVNCAAQMGNAESTAHFDRR
jgi:hypothetical protein